MAIDWSEVKFFKREEWRKDPDKVDPMLVKTLDEIRDLAGVPIKINVAYSQSGHSNSSYHYKGEAVDFVFLGELSFKQQYKILNTHDKLGGIGFYPNWSSGPGWHVDLRPDKLRWIKRNGNYIYCEDELLKALATNSTVRTPY